VVKDKLILEIIYKDECKEEQDNRVSKYENQVEVMKPPCKYKKNADSKFKNWVLGGDVFFAMTTFATKKKEAQQRDIFPP